MAEDLIKEEKLESEESPETSTEEKKKKRSKKPLFILAFILAVPASIVGLHVSGVWDGRPLFYSVVPKLPYVGRSVIKLLDVPEKYLMTAPERRICELREWEDKIAEREKSAALLMSKLDSLSRDLHLRSLQISKTESDLALKEEKKSRTELSEDDKKAFDRVVRTYREISASRAAKIVENLETSLAVRILRSLPEDDGASILGRMDAAKAAWLTEQLAK